MVRIPRSYARAGFARHGGSLPSTGIGRYRPILREPDHLYVRPVTVDLGNDGMAPQVVFPASGTVTALVGPSGGGDWWALDQCFLSTSVGQLDAAQCTVYVGPGAVAQYAVTAALNGGGAQFGMGGVGLAFGWFVWAVWTGGTLGSFAYLRVTGVKMVLSN
jgi:hypothetical protein